MRKMVCSILLGLLILSGCQISDTENTQFWKQSKLCDSKKDCLERGDEYGREIFSNLEDAFGYTNRSNFLQVGLETDDYAQDGELKYNEYVVSEYEKDTETFHHVKGKTNSFTEAFNRFLFDLSSSDLIEIDHLMYLKEGYPISFPNEQTIAMPLYLEELPPTIVTYLTLHELGHFITMNASQTKPEDCDPENIVETCFKNDSYIHAFGEKFWNDYPKEWFNRYYDSQTLQESRELYKKHQNSLVSMYAAVSPLEDIAETFTHFLLSPSNKNAKTEEEKKVQFFYQYDELVEYRTKVLKILQDRVREYGNFYPQN